VVFEAGTGDDVVAAAAADNIDLKTTTMVAMVTEV
jgi:hypothetical protein